MIEATPNPAPSWKSILPDRRSVRQAFDTLALEHLIEAEEPRRD